MVQLLVWDGGVCISLTLVMYLINIFTSKISVIMDMKDLHVKYQYH